MGLFRNIAKAIIIFFFSLSLTLLILTFFLYNLTSYEKAKTIFTNVLTNVMIKNMSMEKIEEFYSNLSLYCKAGRNTTILVTEDVTLNCSEIVDKNSTYLIGLIAEKSFNNLYYKDYGCEFLECLKKIESLDEIAVVFSSTSYKFFSNILQPLFIFSVVFGVLLFILIETWEGRCKVFGFEFLSIGIFFFFLPYLKDILLRELPEGLPINENIFDLIFNEITQILLLFLILGLILIMAWGLIKLRKKAK